jgi:hypothetical protein
LSQSLAGLDILIVLVHAFSSTGNAHTAMVFHNRYHYYYRSGPQDRRHPGRFTYIRGAGWFVYLRGDQEVLDGIEVNSGIAGPFDTQSDAKRYLNRIIKLAHPRPSNAHQRAS